MTAPAFEAVVRGRLIAALRADAALGAAINGVFEPGEPGLTPPYAIAGPVGAGDWGTKDCAGRELTLTLSAVSAERGGDEAAQLGGLLSAAALGIARDGDGVTIATIRLRKSLLRRTRAGDWEVVIDLRVRALALP